MPSVTEKTAAAASRESVAADAYFSSLRAALQEATRRRADPRLRGMATHVEDSPYGGGYRVRTVPADLFVDQIIDGLVPPTPRRRRYG